jgi:hypothetical protein
MRLGRRPLFFLGVSLTFLALLIPTPPEFRHVNLTMSGLALFWCLLLAAEEFAGKGSGTREGDKR